MNYEKIITELKSVREFTNKKSGYEFAICGDWKSFFAQQAQ